MANKGKMNLIDSVFLFCFVSTALYIVIVKFLWP